MRNKLLMLGIMVAMVGAIVFAVSCAPTVVEGSYAKAENCPQIDVTWTYDIDCGVCHTTEDGAHFAEHASEGVTCVQCHTDKSALTLVHEGDISSKTLPTRLKTTSVENSACLSCHDESTEDFIALAAGATCCTDKRLVTENPHAMLTLNADHAEGLFCSSCHKEHETEMPLEDLAKESCLECHHEGEYTCGGCHD